MDIIQFFGRFHVLVLHLPIGILMLAALFEISICIKKSPRPVLINTIWFWGAVSAIAASILGWLLSQAGGYSADAVFIHRTFGILTAVLAILIFTYVCFVKTIKTFIICSFSVAQLFLLFSTGHYGANMTHGETYLVDHAPNIVRTTLGFKVHQIPRDKITQLEQADVYLDLVQPMLQSRCFSCHNDNKQKGKLNLSNIQSLMKGGKSGPAIVANDLNSSELFARINLGHEEKGFMPAEGKTPLTIQQTKAIAWWINVGAPGQGKVTDFKLEKQHKQNLNELFGLNNGRLSLPKIKPISVQQEQALLDAGFVIKRISQTQDYLSLDLSVKRQPVNKQAVNALLDVSQHVLALNLRKTRLTDIQLAQISQLTNLQKLRLEHNIITSEGVKSLLPLKNLRSLNLYRTKVDDSLLTFLAEFKALETVFIGETLISSDNIEAFSNTSDIKVQGITAASPIIKKKES
jgi:hypothetical protein